MYDERKAAGRRGERRRLARYEFDRSIASEMRRPPSKARRIARQENDPRAEAVRSIRRAEGFHEPRSDESGAAGDEYALAAQLFPKVARMLENVLRGRIRDPRSRRRRSANGSHDPFDFAWRQADRRR